MPTPDSLSRIDWIVSSCRLLAATRAEFEREKPFRGLTIGTAIHLEPKTAALLLTLAAGGARVVSTGNLNSTQPETVDCLRAHGIDVIGERTTEASAHERFLDAIIAEQPDLLLDNGGDLFARVAERGYAKLRGGTEETTTGRARLAPLRDKIKVPVLVINDSPIKQFAENRHAVGQSLFETICASPIARPTASASRSLATAPAAAASPPAFATLSARSASSTSIR